MCVADGHVLIICPCNYLHDMDRCFHRCGQRMTQRSRRSRSAREPNLRADTKAQRGRAHGKEQVPRAARTKSTRTRRPAEETGGLLHEKHASGDDVEKGYIEGKAKSRRPEPSNHKKDRCPGSRSTSKSKSSSMSSSSSSRSRRKKEAEATESLISNAC